MVFAADFLYPAPKHDSVQQAFVHRFINWDGAYYRDIAAHGYSYDATKPSTLHFFPLYPLIGRGVMEVTGLSAEISLVLTSQLCFLTAILLIGKYADGRASNSQPSIRTATLLAMCFVPAGLFFRMAYSESLFLLLAIGALLLMERRAHPILVGLVVGLATAARPTGLALVPPFVVWLCRLIKERKDLVVWGGLSLPLSVSGLLGFIAYSGIQFGDPLGFAKNMVHWIMRPTSSFGEKLVSLLSFEPIWTIFAPDSPAYWGHHVQPTQMPFALYVANPVYFIIALGLFVAGIGKRWLNASEVLTVLGLLLIPYWTTAYEVQMTGMARYVTVAFPLYLVAGRLLAALPWSMSLGLLAVSTFFLAAYSALFAQWYWFV
jgi:hypothetical protein